MKKRPKKTRLSGFFKLRKIFLKELLTAFKNMIYRRLYFVVAAIHARTAHWHAANTVNGIGIDSLQTLLKPSRPSGHITHYRRASNA